MIIFYFLIFALLLSCGDLPKTIQQKYSHKIVFATAKDIKLGKVAKNSYIVTFKPKKLIKTNNYFNEFKFHSNYLSDYYIYEPGIKDIHFLTTIDLSKGSFDIKNHIHNKAPDTINWIWQKDQYKSNIGIMAKVQFNSLQNSYDILQKWYKEGKIWFAEPNYQNKLLGWWRDKKSEYDSTFSEAPLWHTEINLSGAFEALDSIAGSSDKTPLIAVMDSGVDVLHPSLKDHIWQNSNLGARWCGSNDLYGCNTSNPKKGYLGDGDVWPSGTENFGQPCPSTEDDNCSHGTHVAGIIVGNADAANNSAGICPICKIIVLRIVGKNKYSDKAVLLDSSIINALKYIALFKNENTLDIRIINSSFGKFERSRAVSILISAIENIPEQHGAILIGASGNEDTDKYEYPAALPEAIAVSNIEYQNNDYAKSTRSNFGRWVDIAAPGQHISSTIPGGTYGEKSGTSMATPVVSAVAGLVVSTNPLISTTDLRNAIIKSADPIKLYSSDINKAYAPKIKGYPTNVPLLGSGVIDAQKAVTFVVSEGQYSVTALDRVSCGSIPGNNKAGNLTLLVLLMLVPFSIKFFEKFFSL